MKNPELVKKLIAELKANAESDFEYRHIDILERALTSPPIAVRIDDTHQEFNGVVYSESHSGHYTTGIHIHREVWKYYNGNIPGGYDIHHIDEDKANNDISNLQMLTHSDHQRLHTSNHYEKRQKQTFICEHCGKEYTAYNSGNNRFCSNHCMSVHKYKKQPKEIVACLMCGKKFEAFVNKHAKFCCKKCADHFRYINDGGEIKTCAVCGKSFKPNRDQKYCSHSCAAKSKSSKYIIQPPLF